MDREMEIIPLEGLSSLIEDIHGKTREASQNTDRDMRGFSGINKVLQSIQCGLLNNTSKLTEINKRIKRDSKLLNNTSKLIEINKQIKRDSKNLKEVENDPTYSDEQRQLYRKRLDELNTKKQARLGILSQNRKDF